MGSWWWYRCSRVSGPPYSAAGGGGAGAVGSTSGAPKEPAPGGNGLQFKLSGPPASTQPVQTQHLEHQVLAVDGLVVEEQDLLLELLQLVVMVVVQMVETLLNQIMDQVMTPRWQLVVVDQSIWKSTQRWKWWKWNIL